MIKGMVGVFFQRDFSIRYKGIAMIYSTCVKWYLRKEDWKEQEIETRCISVHPMCPS